MPLPSLSCRAPRSRSVGRAVVFALCSILATAADGAAAGLLPALAPADQVQGAPARDALPAPAARDAVQAPRPGCAAWTDRCVTCERRTEGRVSCSNVGIACTPEAVQCLRSETAVQDKPPDGRKDEN